MNILIKIPKVKTNPEGSVSRCPYCKGNILVRYGKRRRTLKDPDIREVEVQRWKCLSCNKTFTQRPEGVSRKLSSDFVVSLAIILYTFGLSYDNISKTLSIFEVFIDPSTIWRYIQECGQKLRKRKKNGRYSIAGFDQTYMKVKGEKKIVNMVFSKDGILLDVELLPDETSETFRRKINKLKEDFGIEIVVTDDHSSYENGFIDTGVERQLCLVHALKNIGKALKKANFSKEEKELIFKLARSPTKEGGDILWMMYRKKLEEKGSRDEVTQILLRLTEKWRDLTTYERRRGVPRDNNFTERCIGRTKIRYGTTRGLKSEEGLLNFIYVTQEIWRENALGRIDLKGLIA